MAQFYRLVSCAVAAQLMAGSAAIAADDETNSRRGEGQSVLGYVALKTEPTDCSAATLKENNEGKNVDEATAWACAEKDWRHLRDWYYKEGQRLRDFRNWLSWTTAAGAGCTIIVDKRAGETTSRSCIATGLAPLIYDELTITTYRKRLIDKAIYALDVVRNRYSTLPSYVEELRIARDILNKHEVNCDEVRNDIIKLERAPQDSAVRVVKQELASLYRICISHRLIDIEISETRLKFDAYDPIISSYISYYNGISTDIYNAYNNTSATPVETFSTIISAPFSAISKALSDGTGMKTYAPKRVHSPDVFNFDLPALVAFPEPAKPMPDEALRNGLSDDGRNSLEEVAKAGYLEKAKLSEGQVREMAVHAAKLGVQLADRLPDVVRARVAMDNIRRVCAPFNVKIDMRDTPVEGATPAKK